MPGRECLHPGMHFLPVLIEHLEERSSMHSLSTLMRTHERSNIDSITSSDLPARSLIGSLDVLPRLSRSWPGVREHRS